MIMMLADITIGAGAGIIVSAFTAIGIFLAGLIVQQSRANRARIDALALDVRTLQTQVSPFWASLQSKIADSLHNPDPQSKAMDDLLEKLKANNLTIEERDALKLRLKALMAEAPHDIASKAAALLVVMPLVVKEQAGELPPTDQRSMEQKKIEK